MYHLHRLVCDKRMPEMWPTGIFILKSVGLVGQWLIGSRSTCSNASHANKVIHCAHAHTTQPSCSFASIMGPGMFAHVFQSIPGAPLGPLDTREHRTLDAPTGGAAESASGDASAASPQLHPPARRAIFRHYHAPWLSPPPVRLVFTNSRAQCSAAPSASPARRPSFHLALPSSASTRSFACHPRYTRSFKIAAFPDHVVIATLCLFDSVTVEPLIL